MAKVNQTMVFSGNVYAKSADGVLCNFDWEDDELKVSKMKKNFLIS